MEERRKTTLTDTDIQLMATSFSEAIKGNERKIFGFKIQELVIIGSIFVSVIAFYLRTEEAMQMLVESNKYLTKFTENSDIYHSVVLGTPFQQGKPIDASFDLIRVRNIVNGEKKST